MNYKVRVKAGCKGPIGVEAMGDASLVVRVHARAHDGEANEAVVSLLSAHFGVAKGRIRIISGQKSKNKLIAVD